MTDQHLKVTVHNGYDIVLEVKNDAFASLVLHKYHSKFDSEKKEESEISILRDKIKDLTSSRDYYVRVQNDKCKEIELQKKTIEALKAEAAQIKSRLADIAEPPSC